MAHHRSAWLALLIAALAPPGCEARPRPAPEPIGPESPAASSASVPDASDQGDGGSAQPGTAAARPPVSEDGGQARCGDGSCAFDWECVDGRCCSFLQSCMGTCCGEEEHCNVYQCYRPLLCGAGLPACPQLTYCEDYEEGTRGCANASHRENNREFCARMDAGAAWIAAHGKTAGGKRATGTCFPVMAPHRLGGVRWYRTLGPTAMSRAGRADAGR